MSKKTQKSDKEAVISVGYDEVLEIVLRELDKIRSTRRMRSWCEEKELSYSGVVGLLNNTTKRPQPNKLLELLMHLGYSNVKIDKVYIYKIPIAEIMRDKNED